MRFRNLDAIRLLLASLVVVYHSFGLAGNYADDPLFRLTGQYKTGTLAVDLFFVISGFLILRSRQNAPSFWRFAMNRELRVFPGFVVASLACVMMYGAFHPAGFAQALSQLPVKLLSYGRIQVGGAYPRTSDLNVPLWSIPYEVGCYLSLAGLYALGFYRKAWPALILFALCFGAYVWQGGPIDKDMLNAWPRLLMWFTAGAVLNLTVKSFDAKVAALLGIVLACAVPYGLTLYVAPLTLPYIVMWAGTARAIPFLKIDISYGTYLYGWLCQQAIALLVPGIGVWALAGIALPCALLCGALSFVLVERPFLRLKTWNPTRAPEMALEAA